MKIFERIVSVSAAAALTAAFAGASGFAEVCAADTDFKIVSGGHGCSFSRPVFCITDKTASGGADIAPLTGVYSAGDSGAGAMPGRFDMRDVYPVTPVKNQSPYGTCWAHSAIASAESSVVRSDPTVDLSELHAAYYANFPNWIYDTEPTYVKELLNGGGSATAVTHLWAQWKGPAPESVMPYDDVSKLYDREYVEQNTPIISAMPTASTSTAKGRMRRRSRCSSSSSSTAEMPLTCPSMPMP